MYWFGLYCVLRGVGEEQEVVHMVTCTLRPFCDHQRNQLTDKVGIKNNVLTNTLTPSLPSVCVDEMLLCQNSRTYVLFLYKCTYVCTYLRT